MLYYENFWCPRGRRSSFGIGERTGDLDNLERASRYVVGGMDAFLKSMARRVKYDFLLWKVFAQNDVGFLPKEVVYQRSLGWDTPYRVSITKPEGEVQITPKTKVSVILMKL